jgi:hypothetical protein
LSESYRKWFPAVTSLESGDEVPGSVTTERTWAYKGHYHLFPEDGEQFVFFYLNLPRVA